MQSFVLISDLDNTLIGNDTALASLNERLREYRQEIKLVYSTGRSLYLYQQLTTTHKLLTPDALITSVGTEIYFNPNQPETDSTWTNILSQGWNREAAAAIGSKFPQLKNQPESEQNPFKISYYLDENQASKIISQLESALANEGLETKIIYSASQDLDILPLRGDKGLALEYLQDKWQVNSDKIVAAGDSGNDIALLTGEHRGIIVGNAKSELKQWYEKQNTNNLYQAKANYAAGILEGLLYFGFLP